MKKEKIGKWILGHAPKIYKLSFKKTLDIDVYLEVEEDSTQAKLWESIKKDVLEELETSAEDHKVTSHLKRIGKPEEIKDLKNIAVGWIPFGEKGNAGASIEWSVERRLAAKVLVGHECTVCACCEDNGICLEFDDGLVWLTCSECSEQLSKKIEYTK